MVFFARIDENISLNSSRCLHISRTDEAEISISRF